MCWQIEAETLAPTRERFVLGFLRKRREFGSAYKCSDRDAQEDPYITANDCRQYKDPNFDLRRKEISVGVQAIPDQLQVTTQTDWFRPVNKAEQTIAISMNLRQQMEELDSSRMLDFLGAVRGGLEEALQQNESVDIFGDDFADLAEDDQSLGNKADSELKELQSYYHLQYCTGRLLSFIQWQPQVKGVVGVSTARNLSFDDRVNLSGKVHTGYVLLWNFSDPINPQYVLEAPGDIFCFRFCPNDPDVVIGGLETGQVAVWNLKQARTAAREARALQDDSTDGGDGGHTTTHCSATVLSAVDQSHRRAITDMVWLPPTFDINDKGKFLRKEAPTGAETTMFITIGGDGLILFWDLRKSIETPDEQQPSTGPGSKSKKDGWGPSSKMSLLNPDGGHELSPVHALLQIPDEEDGLCHITAATEEGELTSVDLLHPAAEGFVKGVRHVLPAHTGPCVGLHRSPFVPGIYLSVGDWTFTMWMDGVDSPVFVSPFCSVLYTCGAFSPSRPAVIFLGRSDGFIDIWDLNDRTHEPSVSVTATSAAVASMEFQTSAQRQMLAVGDDQGTVRVMEVPRNLRRAANNELKFATNFFSREEKRVKYVQRRLEVISELRQAAKGEAQPVPVPTGDDAGKEGEGEDKLELAFRALEETFVEEMGFNVPAEEDAPAEPEE